MGPTVANGTATTIPNFTLENMGLFPVSPDGQYIAFSANRESSTSENVYVMAADGSGETRISASPSYQEPIGWSRDGSQMLYMQNGDPVSLSAVPIADGRVRGPGVKIDTQFGHKTDDFPGVTPCGGLPPR